MERNLEQNAKFPKAFLELLEQNTNRLLAALLIDQLAKRGVTRYYLSPGHRNAPLMAAIHHHPLTQIELVIDERSAGYQAIGYAAATETCPALVCTSGTALANYYPALIEAHASELPLLVISADRPPLQVAVGDNQTIVQPGIYAHFAPSCDLGGLWHQSLHHLPETLDALLATRTPTHLNIPFEEPLGGEKKPVPHRIQEESVTLLESHSSVPKRLISESANLEVFLNEIRHARSLLVVVGEIKSLSERQSLLPFFQSSLLPFCLDVTSGIKYFFNLENRALPCFSHPEVSIYLKEQSIDAILHIGGRMTSKEYYQFLKDNPHIKVFNISASSYRRDPALRTHMFLQGPPASLCSLLPAPPAWTTFPRHQAEKKIAWVSRNPLSFPLISKSLIETIPEGAPLFVGNSTAIRAFDNFISLSLNKDIPLYCNRGVSGIEGHIASALGIARGSRQTTTVVLGDISFLHDLNSLHSIRDTREGLIVVLVNDGGGGIFNLLPTAEEKDILPYMTTPHTLRFEALAKQFDLPYRMALNNEELIQSYRFLLEKKHGLLEVILESENNLAVYRQLKTLKEAHVLL